MDGIVNARNYILTGATFEEIVTLYLKRVRIDIDFLAHSQTPTPDPRNMKTHPGKSATAIQQDTCFCSMCEN